MATQSNKLGNCIAPIHLDRLLPAKMDHTISPSQCGWWSPLLWKDCKNWWHNMRWLLHRSNIMQVIMLCLRPKTASSSHVYCSISFPLWLPTGVDRARQTPSGEWKGYSLYIREIKDERDETYLIILEPINSHIVFVPTMPQLRGHKQMAPWEPED